MNHTSGDLASWLDSPSSVRRFLAAASLLCTLLLVYASLVPLTFRPMPWAEAWEAWRTIPWLSLDIFHRSDWVANALVVLPAGVLAAAAVDWGRTTNWQLLVASPLIAFGLALVVIGIELMQVWFPPRTVSLNDIAAGLIGAALGPMLWAVGGAFCERAVTQFLTLPRFQDRLKWLCALAIVGMLFYTVLPLDLVVRRDEWGDRWASGRIQLLPFIGNSSASAQLLDLAFSALRMVPIGILVAFVGVRRAVRWGTLWGLPIVLETLQIPIYSKFVTGAAVIGGWAGGWAGFSIGERLELLVEIARKQIVWVTGWIASYVTLLLALLGGFDQVVTDAAEVAQRFQNAWAPPFAKYYAGSEYSAYTSVAEKMLLFAAVGICCRGWMCTAAARHRNLILWTSLVVVTATSVIVEAVQVYLPPLVPDFTDIIVYLAGYFLGYAIAVVLGDGSLPATDSHAREPASRHRDSDLATSVGTRRDQVEGQIELAALGDLPKHVARIASFSFGLFGVVLASQWAFGWGWGIAAYLGLVAMLAARPHWWKFLLPAVVVTGDCYLSTGDLLYGESDLFCFAALSVLLWRQPEVTASYLGNRRFVMLWGPFCLSLCLSVWRGWVFLPAAESGDQLAIYLTQLNSLRVFKGLFWGVLFAPYIIDAARRCEQLLPFVASFQFAALFVGLGVLLERSAAVGLWSLDATYRPTGPLASMHIGGQHLDAFWVLSLPLLFLPRVRDLSVLALCLRTVVMIISLVAIIFTLSRAPIAISAIQLVVCIVICIALAGRGIDNKLFAVSLSAVLLVAGVLGVRALSSPIEQRLSHSVDDFATRRDHWRKLCEATRANGTSFAIGEGLGTLPRLFANISSYAIPQAEVQRHDGKATLMLQPGRHFYVEQRIDRLAPRPWRLRGMIKSTGEAQCGIAICRKSLIDSFEIFNANLPKENPNGDWMEFDITIDPQDVSETSDSWWGLPVLFSIGSGGAKGTASLAQLSLEDADGRAMLKNADFADGSKFWFFTSDDHLDWHAKNMWVHLFVEQGMFGVIGFAWLIGYSSLLALQRAMRTSSFTAWILLVSMAGIFAIGTFESIFDAPWEVQLVLLVVALLQGIGGLNESPADDRSRSWADLQGFHVSAETDRDCGSDGANDMLRGPAR